MVIQRLIELLAPVQCLHCGQDGAILCPEGVARSSAGRFEPRRGTALAGLVVGAYYGGAVKELVSRLKFHRLRSAAQPAGDLLVRAWPEELRPQLVTGVPIAPDRYRERGYNQAELIGRAVAKRLGVPYAPLLGRETSLHQTGQARAERLSQVRGAFFARRTLRGERVLVVDDVVTTGATLEECARTLAEAGAGTVWGGAVARH